MSSISYLGYELERSAAHLRQLADDLEGIAAGTAPTAALLAAAPVLSQWRPELTPRNDPAISGVVTGHDSIADGDVVYIELIAGDPDMRWIKSFTGWYVLGTPADGVEGCGHA
jgi:hypothetical protein